MPQRDLPIAISTRREDIVVPKDSRTYAQIHTRIEDRVRVNANTGEVHAVDLSDPEVNQVARVQQPARQTFRSGAVARIVRTPRGIVVDRERIAPAFHLYDRRHG